MNLLTFYVLDRLEEYSAAYYEAELLARQNRAYQAEFELMRQSERQISALRHDMKNHLAVLREYAAQGRLDKLEQYLNTFDQKLTRADFQLLKRVVLDGCTMLDAAEEQGITVEACKKRVQRIRAYLKQKLADF